jgi:hypothetical protein
MACATNRPNGGRPTSEHVAGSQDAIERDGETGQAKGTRRVAAISAAEITCRAS